MSRRAQPPAGGTAPFCRPWSARLLRKGRAGLLCLCAALQYMHERAVKACRELQAAVTGCVTGSGRTAVRTGPRRHRAGSAQR